MLFVLFKNTDMLSENKTTKNKRDAGSEKYASHSPSLACSHRLLAQHHSALTSTCAANVVNKLFVLPDRMLITPAGMSDVSIT